ncbi:hypothetical protein [Aneurinibacillus aneurinilyticus]|uniref:hypothetical protein n=1 Tax=Aneurinibacillus aneurinilyticus TaxID=1391 RepID=UPI003524C7E9
MLKADEQYFSLPLCMILCKFEQPTKKCKTAIKRAFFECIMAVGTDKIIENGQTRVVIGFMKG